jgi:hypothetical protein
MPAQRRFPVALRQQTTAGRTNISAKKSIAIEFALALFANEIVH